MRSNELDFYFEARAYFLLMEGRGQK